MVYDGFVTFVATPCDATGSSRETEARLGHLTRIVRKWIRIRYRPGTGFAAD